MAYFDDAIYIFRKESTSDIPPQPILLTIAHPSSVLAAEPNENVFSQKLCSPSWFYFIPTFPLSGSSNLNPQLKSQARETIGSAPEDKTKMRGLQALLVWNDLSGKGLEGAESVETPYETNLYDPGTIALQSLGIQVNSSISSRRNVPALRLNGSSRFSRLKPGGSRKLFPKLAAITCKSAGV